MRNLHLDVHHHSDVKLLYEWEDLVRKMLDFGNHRRFTIRCLKTGITPVSYKRKNTIRTLKVTIS